MKHLKFIGALTGALLLSLGLVIGMVFTLKGCDDAAQARAKRKLELAEKKAKELIIQQENERKQLAVQERVRAAQDAADAKRQQQRHLDAIMREAVNMNQVDIDLKSWEPSSELGGIMLTINVTNQTDYTLDSLQLQVSIKNDMGSRIGSGKVTVSHIKNEPVPPHSVKERVTFFRTEFNPRYAYRLGAAVDEIHLK